MVVSSELLSRAAKEVQIADHLISVTYRFAGESKILFRVMAHACNAIDDARKALGETDMNVIPTGEEALSIYKRFAYLLSQHDEAPVVFRRRSTYVIASEGFANVSEVTLSDVRNGLQTIKQFVFQAGKHLLVTV